jgi:hypothetical protein
MTAWARDRWLALGPGDDGETTLLAPAAEDGADAWPARAGDHRIAGDLAAALPHVRARTSGLVFDGGDFVADAETVFVSPRVARRNRGLAPADLRRRLADALGRRVVLLDDAPDHHAGMYLMPVGNRTVLVGDPAHARRVLGNAVPLDADWSAATQARFDAVARVAAAAGYRVVRMPVAPGRDGRTWLTALNAILDGGTAFVPVFGVASLDEASAEVWRGVGYRVRPVDCTATYRHFGSLRCLVNVLARG